MALLFCTRQPRWTRILPRSSSQQTRNAAQDLLLVVVFLVLDEVEDIFRNLLHGLDEFGLMRIAPIYPVHKCIEIDMIRRRHEPSPWIVAEWKFSGKLFGPRTFLKQSEISILSFYPQVRCPVLQRL
jgi:hypothetical protein